MPRPYPDSAKRENFRGGWNFQKAQPLAQELLTQGVSAIKADHADQWDAE